MKRKIIASSIGVLLLALGIAFFVSMKNKPKAQSKPNEISSVKSVVSGTAEYKDNSISIEANGRVIASNRVEIFSEVGGLVVKSNRDFKTGNRFDAGSSLIKLDDREQKLLLNSQKSDFLRMLTTIMPDLQIDFQESYTIWNNYLKSINIEKELPELPEVKSDKLKYYLSSKNIFSTYYNLKNQELRLSKYTITAPFSCIVVNNLVEVGSLVRVGQKLGDIISSGLPELELSITPNEANYVKVGAKVSIASEDMGIKANGKVLRISDFIDPTTQSVKVFVGVDSKSIKDGMYMRATIDGGLLPNTVQIPRAALLNNKYVNVINKDSTPVKTLVEVVRLTESDAYIRSIKSQSQIVYEPLVNYVPGTKIKAIVQQQ